MADFLNRLLRPLFKLIFLKLYPPLPWREKILWFFSKNYFINGTVDLLRTTTELSKNGYFVFWNHCTEDAETFDDINNSYNFYLYFIECAKSIGRAPYVTLSLKMSQFGCFNQDKARACLGKYFLEMIIRFASGAGMTVMLDGERLVYAEAVADFARKMNEKYANTGVRLQAYNPKFKELLDEIFFWNSLTKASLPLGFCKGAYNELPAVSAAATRENMIKGVRACYDKICPVSLDTNDHRLANEISLGILPRAPFGRPRPTFGLLYNVKPWLARQLKERGEIVRIYLPVITGDQDRHGVPARGQWEKFAIRRLIERPVYILMPLKTFMDKILLRKDYF